MLNQVLHEIENARGPLTVNELSRKLGIDPAALEGMIEFWVRKGRLQVENDQTSGASCACGSGGSSCAPVSEGVQISKSYVGQQRK